MLLALDVGNTNITIGAFRSGGLVGRWRLRTVLNQTPDELGVLIRNLFSLAALDLAAVDGIIVSSVVPPLDGAVEAMAERYFHTRALFVDHTTDTGLEIGYDNPREVGADRVVNSVAAFHKYGGPCVVVDLGTAITFDAISREGRYLGGVICPGIGISVEALFAKTARLPLVEFRAPDKLIGTNTVGSMQSGLYYGAIGMIDGILERLFEVLGPATRSVATGGEARLIVRGSKYLKEVDEDLTLEGLRLIWERNRVSRSV
ncbi:MAG: type III pantothenate kinase [Bryobacterales bacterium]|nr:type III pantothenate kinase [Bryobacteraceae bacterium]MDW8353474.1 type III pantothenate kinase [Bryobacterales bacterium]